MLLIFLYDVLSIDGITMALYGKEKTLAKTSLYDCVDKDMNGNVVKMSQFAGNVLLFVNVASN
jgi:Glutathione peroxidase